MKKIKWLTFIGVACLWASGVVFSASPTMLKPGDVVTITVKGEPELSGDRIIAYDGSINLPLIGSVGVSGMKPTDAALMIKQQLEDGFLKNPVVTITPKSLSNNSKNTSNTKTVKTTSPSASQMTEADLTYATIDDKPLGMDESLMESDESDVTENTIYNEEQILVELKDLVNNNGIANAVLSIDNKVYQSNRLGQILINRSNGNAIVIADGYKTLSGSLNKLIKSGRAGSPSYINLEKIRYNENMLCTVVDSKTKKP
ncbi:MAG: polysaccharide biosynthesis/export family protein, partial [Candidatus Riflebacteria bacterium]|nr:polysaccharide biosynthesis/export family protein [Candidatus Riflebacteria bacterium]